MLSPKQSPTAEGSLMGWNTFSTVCGFEKDPFTGEQHPALLIIKTPLHWYLIDKVVGGLCELLGYRFCMSWPFHNLLVGSLGREEKFEVSVPDEVLSRYAVWRGWECWDFSDEEEFDELSE